MLNKVNLLSALSAGTQVGSRGTISFANSNGVTFGMSGSNTITASVATSLTNINVSAGATSNNLSAITFNNGNGVTFGLTGSVITASVAAAGGAQTGISGIVASDTTYTSGTISFSNQGNITIGSSVNGATQYVRLSVAAQTNQSAIKAFGVTNTGNTLGNTGVSTGIDWVIAATNSLTVSESTAVGGPNTLWLSVGAYITTAALSGDTSKYVQAWELTGGTAGTTSSLQGTKIYFSGANNITVSGNSNTIAISAAAQSNQTEGIYVVGNTTANSSSRTVDARTLSISGAGAVSVGWDTAASQLVISGGTAAVGSLSFYGLGNTTGTSSGTGAGTLSINAIGGAISVAASNSGWNLSVPQTSSLSATGIVSISTNGSTISIGAATFNAYALNTTTQNSSSNLDLRSVSFNATGAGLSVGYSNGSIILSTPPCISYLDLVPFYFNTVTSSFAQSTSIMVPFMVPEAISIGSLRLFEVGTVAASSTQGLVNGSTLSMSGRTSHNLVFYSRGTGANSMSLQYVTSTQVVDAVSMNVQNAAGANSSQLSYSLRFSLGNVSFTKDYSSTAQSYNFHTSQLTDLTGTKQVDYPCGVSLSGGQWFLAYGRSTTFDTQNAVISVATRLNISYDSQFVVTQNTQGAIGTLGGATNSSIMFAPTGLGSFSTGGGAGTTNSLNISVISSGSSNQIPAFQLIRIA